MAALVDLRFADAASRAKHDCKTCTDLVKKARRCGEASFEVMKPRQSDKASLAYPFCPGKATWYPWLEEAYDQCRVAVETGILPKGGSLEDQDYTFTMVLPVFVERWRARRYQSVWDDVNEAINRVLKAVFPKK